MKVYINPMTPTSKMVLITLAEKSAEPEIITIDFRRGEQKSPEHLARNPFGVTPVIDDDGFVLYEARPILRYLDQRLPGPSLTPADLHERAIMDQFISIESSYFSPNAMVLVYAQWRPTDPSEIERAKSALTTPLDVAERRLASRTYIAGDAFSLADIVWMPYVSYLFERGVADLVTTRPGLHAWWQRVSERPSWRKASA